MALTPDQLYQQQQQMNQYGAIASQSAGLLGQFYSQAHQNDNINISAPDQQVDMYGKPTYNLGNFQQQISGINTKGASAGQLLGGAAQGAAIGANPALVAATGGLSIAIGAGVGAVGSAIGGAIGSARATRRKQLAQQSLMAAQRSYNSHMATYNDQQLGQQQYRDDQSPDNRMYNLYKYTTPYS